MMVLTYTMKEILVIHEGTVCVIPDFPVHLMSKRRGRWFIHILFEPLPRLRIKLVQMVIAW